MRQRLQKILALALLSLLLWTGVTACAPEPPSRFEQAQQQSTERGAKAVAKESTQGSEFNRFFPSAGQGFERVYTQEKKGFAEAKLKKDGKDLAVMAISDVVNTPGAADKFKSSSAQISGFPAVQQGSTGTAVLVADRYQVKVLSRDPNFSAADRELWLGKFNLKGLAQLK